METTILGVEFKVIIPLPLGYITFGNTLESFEQALLVEFGGFTATYGQGAWANDRSQQRVRIYTVAAPSRKQATLEKLALEYAEAAGETAIYVSKTDSVAALLWPS